MFYSHLPVTLYLSTVMEPETSHKRVACLFVTYRQTIRSFDPRTLCVKIKPEPSLKQEENIIAMQTGKEIAFDLSTAVTSNEDLGIIQQLKTKLFFKQSYE